ncbi:MAG: hypothetical protein ACPGJV_06905 [Bacteriovoracaceae bacterium]
MDHSREIIFKKETYQEVEGLHPRVHAKELDRIFGYKIPKIEEKLNQKYRVYYQANDESNRKKHFEGTQTWIGLHPQVLQTPYSEILACFQFLKDENVESIIDIGSAYGRVGLVKNCLFPDAEFLGYEILKKRECEGNRIFQKYGLNNCKILNENVLDDNFELPDAQVYFIYDFSEYNDICTILDLLSLKVGRLKFFLISKGEQLDFLISKKYRDFWKTHSLVSIGDLKIYQPG